MQAQLASASTDQQGKLAKALMNALEMRAEDASEVASLVLMAFNGDEELDDEELSTDLRSMFYTLEEQKLLDFRREEFKNEDGNLRRAFYWTVRWDEVEETAKGTPATRPSHETVYDDLPSNAWDRTVTR